MNVAEVSSVTGLAARRELFTDKSVALVHEWFSATGGSEQVFMRIGELIPQAARFVLWKEADAQVNDLDLRESWLSRTPLRHNKALALPFMPVAWRTLTRQRFDVVISSSHAFAHTVKLGSSRETQYLSYVHSPARYIWSPEVDSRGSSSALTLARKALQLGDRRLSRHVTSYAANSREVQARIRRYWRRDARVIHPPVDVEFFGDAPREVQAQERRYLFGFGRWVPYKNFDLMIEIASEAGLPLVIAGSGPEEGSLRRLARQAKQPVAFEVRPTRKRLRELYWGAKALLYPAQEDFGIIPVEAQACGTPVIGQAGGGLLETVVHGETGFLIPAVDPRRYSSLITEVATLSVTSIRRNAQRFTPQSFYSDLESWLRDDAGASG